MKTLSLMDSGVNKKWSIHCFPLTMSQLVSWIIFCLWLWLSVVECAACQACWSLYPLGIMKQNHVGRHRHYPHSLGQKFSVLLPLGAMVVRRGYQIPSFHRSCFLNSRKESEESIPTEFDDENDEDQEEKGAVDSQDESPLSTAAIGTLRFYKSFISPLLPPACRFFPTCSQYGVQAIQEFGTTKGCILIAWRLLRCSPFGGKGYDPPRWPPVHFTYSSY
jgi:uncharacterized protein